MDIYLHNTLTGKKELFKPITSGVVTMYNCGPTVYDYAHIGNLRSYVFADVLRRMFEYNSYEVNQVVNITDIGHLSSDGDDGEDKMSKALRREGKPMTMVAMREVADFYFEKFESDLVALGIKLPTHFPFASDHIAEDIALIETLTGKGYAYVTSDGIYFDTAKFPGYGKLGNIPQDDGEHSRIGVNSEKKNARDFALWKFSSPRHSRADVSVGWDPHTRSEDDGPRWALQTFQQKSTVGNPGFAESPLGYEASFGKGFPGWHIECSAMSRKYLGQPLDIHTGGIDHIPVHHNNEIAQSEAAYGVPLANVWMHNAFLNTGVDKMAKSAGNFITLQTLKEKGIDPLALRYLYLTARYSSPLDFSWDALEGAQTTLKRLKRVFLDNYGIEKSAESDKGDDETKKYKNKFNQFINDDLDTPRAIALIWDILKDPSISIKNKKTLFLDFDKVLGFELGKSEETIEIPAEVQKLIAERDTARADKNWARSDQLREDIEKLGFAVKDSDSGVKVEKI